MKNSSYRKYWRIVLVLFIVGIMALAPGLAANDFDGFVEWGGYPQGADSEEPGYIGDGPRTEDGWIHWVLTGNNSNIEYAEVILGGTGSGEYPAEEDSYGSGSLHFFTPYFELDGLEAIAYYTGTAANNVQLIISDYYSGTGEEELIVSKTVETFFTRQHLWDIDKEVTTENEEFLDGDPKIWLIDVEDVEMATWNVDVAYLGFEDSGFNVTGTVTIENTGDVDAVITDVVDVLGSMTVEVDFGVDFELPFTLAAGETLIGNYSEDVVSKIEGNNEVNITTERDLYGAVEPIIWGEPAEEIDAVINIEDDSDLFEEIQFLGTLDAADLDEGEVTTFDYSYTFRWVDFEVSSYTFNNTATIVETEQSASAVLKVNVPAEEIMVSKTVETTFNLEHFWDIDKEVTTDKGDLLEGLPKIWLVFVEDEEIATWKVDVTYLGYEESDFNVSGTVTIENTGTIPAVITDIADVLGGIPVEVDFGVEFELPYTLAVGETLVGTYNEDVDSKIEGKNELTVTTTKHDYDAEANIIWGEPVNVVNAEVTIEDDSDLFEEIQFLGTLDAANLDEGEVTIFDYSNTFRWVDFVVGSYTYNNTATIVETEQSASAVLKVNVPAEEIMVSKNVETSFTREHSWGINKFVETEFGYTVDIDTAKIWLFIDGSGDELATWNIDVTYLGFEDSDFNVSGTVTIENTGTIPAVLTGYEDFLGGVEIDVDFGVDFPHILAEGETLEGTYSEEGFFEGMNEVTIMTTKDEYSADAEILWEDPDEEINAVVTIEDDSDFFGLEELGTVDSADLLEGDVVNFNYDHLFEYGLYEGPAVIENTAKIVESGQKASAILKINTQEFIYESAWAKGDGAVSFTDSGFSNWGWTNPIEEGTHEMDLWAGAAQSDTSKGTLVGTVTVVYNGGIDVTFNLDYGHTLEESHVYAGDDMFPQQRRGQRTVNTVAPGQYYIEDELSGGIWVIVHGVVGMPDPDFGPNSVY